MRIACGGDDITRNARISSPAAWGALSGPRAMNSGRDCSSGKNQSEGLKKGTGEGRVVRDSYASSG